MLASCGNDPQVVSLGGSIVERPWGTVRTFPTVEKAQIPTVADLDFTRHMIIHHEQAVRLSTLVLQHRDIDERIAAAARFIAQDQTREITAMQQWVDAWMSSPGVLPHGAHHSSTVDAHDMPGMVSAAAVESIGRLDSADAQAEFVDLMLFHHEGAITMSHDVIEDGSNDFVLSVARHLIREQGLEIDYLRRLAPEIQASSEAGSG